MSADSNDQSQTEDQSDQGDEDAGDEEDEGGEDDEEEDPSLFRRAGNLFGSVRERIGEGTSRLGQAGRNGLNTVGNGLRSGASSVSSGVGEGYQLGKEKLGTLWHEHPLVIGAGILALGFAAGMILPATVAEKNLLGGRLGKVTRRIRKASRELLSQGKDMSEKVWTETGNAVSEMADREGLTPDKLTRKVKRIAGRVKDVVSEAFEE